MKAQALRFPHFPEPDCSSIELFPCSPTFPKQERNLSATMPAYYPGRSAFDENWYLRKLSEELRFPQRMSPFVILPLWAHTLSFFSRIFSVVVAD
jgi:hypothetical protein